MTKKGNEAIFQGQTKKENEAIFQGGKGKLKKTNNYTACATGSSANCVKLQ